MYFITVRLGPITTNRPSHHPTWWRRIRAWEQKLRQEMRSERWSIHMLNCTMTTKRQLKNENGRPCTRIGKYSGNPAQGMMRQSRRPGGMWRLAKCIDCWRCYSAIRQTTCATLSSVPLAEPDRKWRQNWWRWMAVTWSAHTDWLQQIRSALIIFVLGECFSLFHFRFM